MLVSAWLCLAGQRAACADSISDLLDVAKADYREAVQRHSNDLVLVCQQAAQLVAANNPDAARKLKSEAKAFSELGVLPTSEEAKAGVRRYLDLRRDSAIRLVAAYKKAIKQYTGAGAADKAAALQEELDNFAASEDKIVASLQKSSIVEAKLSEPAPARPDRSAELEEQRMWTNLQGKQMPAKFVRVHGRDVVFRRSNRVVRVPFLGLSAADQELIRSVLERRGRANVLPPATTPATEPELRTWRDTKGKAIEARFIRISGANVFLHEETQDKTVGILFSLLSANDQNHIARVLIAQGQSQFIPRHLMKQPLPPAGAVAKKAPPPPPPKLPKPKQPNPNAVAKQPTRSFPAKPKLDPAAAEALRIAKEEARAKRAKQRKEEQDNTTAALDRPATGDGEDSGSWNEYWMIYFGLMTCALLILGGLWKSMYK